MDLNKENMTKIRNTIIFAVLFYLGMKNISLVLEYASVVVSMLTPFICGAAMAFVLNVPMRFVEKKLFCERKGESARVKKVREKLDRPVSLLLSILLVIVIILIVVLVVLPEIGNTIGRVVRQIEYNIPQLQRWAQETFTKDSQIVTWLDAIEFQPQKMLNSIISVLRNGVDNILSSTLSVTMGVVNTTMNVGIGFIFACYILLQKERLATQLKLTLKAFLPKKQEEYILHVCKLAHKIFASFITGQCIEAVILGTMFFLAMSICRFPYAMLVGVLISFTALIPIFGGFIGCGIGFFLILMENPMQAVGFLILFLILQQLEGNFIYPHVVGNSVGLPSIWVLVAVTLGGSLMGVLGMLIFIPLVSVLYTLFREHVYARLEKTE